MTLLYCVKCAESYDDGNQEYDGIGKLCPVCKDVLKYFGRESTQLSPLEIIKEYDAEHEYRPLEDFKGTTFTDRTRIQLDLSIMECEDMLTHDPDNVDAKYHLAIHAMSKGDLSRAQGLLEDVVSFSPKEADPYKRLVYIYIMTEQPQAALEMVARFKSDTASMGYNETMGKIYMLLRDKKTSMTHFVRAYKGAKTDAEKHKIKTVIRRLQAL
jgi:tetratricopeptide (TPR) repeat protein